VRILNESKKEGGMEIGQIRTIKQRYNRRECEFCEEPATHKLTFLLPNARTNPASSAYRHDDCSWCSDQDVFVCDEHEKDSRKIAGDLKMEWCSSFAYERFKHMFEYWEDIK